MLCLWVEIVFIIRSLKCVFPSFHLNENLLVPKYMPFIQWCVGNKVEKAMNNEQLTTQQENNLYIKPEASEQSPWAPTGKPLSGPSNLKKKKREREIFIFQSSLAHSTIKQEVENSHILPAPSNTASPTISIRNHTAAHVTTDESSLTQYFIDTIHLCHHSVSLHKVSSLALSTLWVGTNV